MVYIFEIRQGYHYSLLIAVYGIHLGCYASDISVIVQSGSLQMPFAVLSNLPLKVSFEKHSKNRSQRRDDKTKRHHHHQVAQLADFPDALSLSLSLSLFLSLSLCLTVSLSLSLCLPVSLSHCLSPLRERYSSLSSLAPDRSSRIHPVSVQCCCLVSSCLSANTGTSMWDGSIEQYHL